MKKIIPYIFYLFTTFIVAQDYISPFHTNYRSLYSNEIFVKGNVKSLIINEENTLWLKKDSIPTAFKVKSETYFNRKGKVTREYNYYLKYRYLKKFNRYKDDTIIVYSKEIIPRKRQTSYKSDTINYYTIEKKFSYNKKNLLLNKFIKSSRQKDYFVVIDNKYNSKNLIITSRHLNNHIDYSLYIGCKADGSCEKDFIITYKYDDDNLIEQKQLESNLAWIDSKHIRTLSKNYKYPFELKKISKFLYEKKLINKHTYYYNDYRGNFNKNRIYSYDNKNRILENYTIDSRRGNVFGKFYEYQKKDSVNLIYEGYITTKYGAKTKLKKLNRIIECFNNQSIKITNFDYCNDITESFYDTEGNLIKEIENRKIVYLCDYLYDNKNNWVKAIQKENGKITKVISRKITYY